MQDLSHGYFGPPTAGHNWCENDYEQSFYVAEFWNTLSNAAYLLVSIGCFRRWWRYHLGPRYLYLGCMLFLLGVTSAFFHASLWWIGQKTDEVFETASLITLLYMHADSSVLHMISHLAVASILIFSISLVFTEVHLLLVSLAVTYKHAVLALKGPPKLLRHSLQAAIFAIGGFSLWVVDFAGCNSIIKQLPFNPQLHAFWHILTAAALHEVSVVSAYGLLEKRGEEPRIKTFLGLAVLVDAKGKYM